jgi:small subunit ribosomal protein S3
MSAGALGAEIVISGKLRGRRAKYEKFRAGYLPKSGEPPAEYLRKAELDVQLKPGIFGVKVVLMPPDAEFPDKIEIVPEEPEPAEEETEAASEEAPTEAATAKAEEGEKG